MEAIGEKGQRKILDSSVLVIGAGGLGSPICLYLAASGVGRIGIADSDFVDISNLQRQIIHFSSDVGLAKIQSAQNKMRAIRPELVVELHDLFVNTTNIGKIIDGYDIIVDAVDSLEAKFLINQACVWGNKPLVHGGIEGFGGEALTVLPGKTACFECIFHKPDFFVIPKRKGPLGPLPGIIGSIQAMECLKLILGVGTPLFNSLLVFDALAMNMKKCKVVRRDDCRACCDSRPLP